jgi:hypothetical protein
MVGYLVGGAFLSVVFYPGLPLFAGIAAAAAAAWRRELLTEALRARSEAPPRLASITELPRRPSWEAAPSLGAVP